MSLHFDDYKNLLVYPLYTFIDHEGNNTHIDSEKLREWCAANRDKLVVERTPIDLKIAKSFLVDNAITLDHVREISLLPALDPIIYCKTGTFSGEPPAPDVMLVDGHHRYFLGAMLHAESIPAYILEVEQWAPFKVEGVPKMTMEDLRRMPTKGSVMVIDSTGVRKI